jgi:hypothetical protein
MLRSLLGGKPVLPTFYAPRLDGPLGYRIRVRALERGTPVMTLAPWPSPAERRGLLRGAKTARGRLIRISWWQMDPRLTHE